MAETRIKDLKNYEGDNNGFMAVDSNMHGTGRLTIKQLSQKIAGGDLTIQVNGASTVYSPVGQAKTVVIDAATHDELQAAERRVEQKVTAETSARESADTELDAKIDTTAENAATALSDAVETLNGSISSVQSNVDAVASDLAHETELRESADGIINDRIDGHIENTANPHAVTAEQVGLGNVDNKSEATIKADFTGEIAEGNEGFVSGGAAYTALGGKQDTLTFDNVPTENSDNPVKSGGVFSEVARLEELIGQTGSFEIVNLTTGENPVPDVDNPSTKVIYLTKDDSSHETDPYTEWIWANGNWDIIGTTSIDMSGYATKQDLNTKQDVIEDLSGIRSGASAGATAVQPAAISDMAVKSEMTITVVSGDDTKKTIQLQSGTAQDVLVAHQDISGKADKSEMSITPDSEDATKATIQLKSGLDTDVLVAHQDISGKQDVIEDLSVIRSGAALGATAYQKPEQGIPNTDLAQAVQDVLVPASTAQDEGKVLTVDSNGGAVWGQSGFVVTLTEDFTTSPSTLSLDKTFTEINTAIQSSQSIKFNYDKKSPIGTVRVFSGSDVQTVYGSYIAFNCVDSNGKVTSVRLNVSDTVSIVESNNLPTSTSSDEGKVLTVDSNGGAVWTTRNNSVEIITANSSSTILSEFTRIRAAGKIPALWYNGATFDGASHDVLCEWKYDTQSGEHVFLGSCIVTPDWNPHPRLYWVTYTESADFTGGGSSYLGLTNIPQTTSSDSDKVLTVDSNGAPVWRQSGSIGLVKDEAIGIEWAGNPAMVGDVVMHEGLRYECTTNNMDEEWDPSHWSLLHVDTDIQRLQRSIGSIKNGGALTDAASVNVYNNALSTLSTAQATLTLNVNVDTNDVPNFAVEVTPSVDCTLTVTKTIAPRGLPTELTPSVAGGTSLTAGKKYQVTCVGSCWTLAEFVASTP